MNEIFRYVCAILLPQISLNEKLYYLKNIAFSEDIQEEVTSVLNFNMSIFAFVIWRLSRYLPTGN